MEKDKQVWIESGPVVLREYIHTYSGGQFHYDEPAAKDIKIKDIAHALSNICRWTGHTEFFYSVAQHCVLCAENIEDKSFALAALLHDAAEAYVGDINKPLKNLLGQVMKDIEARADLAIRIRYGLPEIASPAEKKWVKSVDLRMAMTEAKQLLNQPFVSHYEGAKPFYDLKIEQLSPDEAETMFLAKFKELM